MFGDLVIFIKTKWKQFWCSHDYKIDRIGMITGLNSNRICSKCDKFEN